MGMDASTAQMTADARKLISIFLQSGRDTFHPVNVDTYCYCHWLEEIDGQGVSARCVP